MQQARILIADDEQATCRYIEKQMLMEPELRAAVDFAHDRDTAIGLLRENTAYDLLLIDLWMPDAAGVLDKAAGLKILQRAKEQNPPPEAIIITANRSSETALAASGLGTFDYISKPIDYTQLIQTIKTLLHQRHSDSRQKPTDTQTDADGHEIIGTSPIMIELMTKVGRVAASDTDVLIYGESGTGKEMVARAIHKHSARRKGPFVVVNSSAIPSELIESELFGIGKRVATSVDQRAGKFLLAQGGTIFLDEIGDLGLSIQPKLLRVLDYKEIQGVGLNVQNVNVRIIAATNRDLSRAVADGTFRNDLYYRLKPVITLPPLRERKGDIALLAGHFLRKYAHLSEPRPITGFEDEAMDALARYAWPGNVRELEKSIQYAALTCRGSQISACDLPPEVVNPRQPVDAANRTAPTSNPHQHLMDIPTIREASQAFEREYLAHKLREYEWNIQLTAERIGMRRTSLHRKMKQLGLERGSE